VRKEIKGWHGDRHIVELLTTELATNAVLHAHSPFTVSVQVDQGWVRVEVTDSSPVLPPKPRLPRPDATSGRGLVLVDILATRWGSERLETGKRVWFELAGGAA
jgi:anti-sigma regulatory factor (Ser/Thr protein kinase)